MIPCRKIYSSWKPARTSYLYSHGYTVERWNGWKNQVETYQGMTFSTYAGARSMADYLNTSVQESRAV